MHVSSCGIQYYVCRSQCMAMPMTFDDNELVHLSTINKNHKTNTSKHHVQANQTL